jgi:hypothetical protein
MDAGDLNRLAGLLDELDKSARESGFHVQSGTSIVKTASGDMVATLLWAESETRFPHYEMKDIQ